MKISSKVLGITGAIALCSVATGFVSNEGTINGKIDDLVELAKGYKDTIAKEQNDEAILQGKLNDVVALLNSDTYKSMTGGNVTEDTIMTAINSIATSKDGDHLSALKLIADKLEVTYTDQSTASSIQQAIEGEIADINDKIDGESGLLKALGVTYEDGQFKVTTTAKKDGNLIEKFNYLNEQIGMANKEVQDIEDTVESAIEEVEDYTGQVK